jgi:hypothetical protein
MSDVYRDPAKQPADAKAEPRYEDMEDWGGVRMNQAGPGGVSTFTEHNEKGILEAQLQKVVDGIQTAELQGSHPKWQI